jgi:hypothetical protein
VHGKEVRFRRNKTKKHWSSTSSTWTAHLQAHPTTVAAMLALNNGWGSGTGVDHAEQDRMRRL